MDTERQAPTKTSDARQDMDESRKINLFNKTVLGIALGAGLFVFGMMVGSGRMQLLSGNGFSGETELPTSINYGEVNQVYNALRENYDGKLTEDQIIEGLKHGLAKSTKDPYTEYFTESESSAFNEDLQGTITGIGAKLELDTDGNLIVVAPIAGSPAEAAGLRAKDIIATINGKSTAGISTNEAVVKIRGKKGTSVELGVVRDKRESLTFKIVRDIIRVPTATAKILDGNIGYLQVSQFSGDTDQLVNKGVADFKQKGVSKVILDLRDNPGGEVTTAVNLSSLWLKQGDTIVEQRRGKTVIDSARATSINTLRGMKTVVLVNGGSASASEITALALRDHGAARIIGEKTFGKGVVQQIVPFKDGSALKVTIAKWYSPKGTNVDKKGITPDQEVKLSEDDYRNQNDVQLQAATAWLAGQ